MTLIPDTRGKLESQIFDLRVRRDKLALLERDSSFNTPIRKYYNDPVGFAKDCIKWPVGQFLTDYQAEICEDLVRYKRESVRGPHGLGKTCIAAVLIHWFALTRDGEDWKILTTASVWRQLDVFLWPEVHKWGRMIRWDVVGRPAYSHEEMLTLNLKLDTGAASAIASDNAAAIEGAHADHIFYLYDEAKTIPPDTWDAAEGAFSGSGADTTNEAFALAISTPGDAEGRFFEVQTRRAGTEDWHVRHVTLDEAVNAGRISKDWADQRRRQWGEQSTVFQNRVMGEFSTSSDDGVIPLSWIEQATDRWNTWYEAPERDQYEFTCVSADIARFGGDATVIGMRSGPVLTEFRKYGQIDLMESTGHIIAAYKANNAGYIIVDVIGIGAGVVDRLREQGYKVVPFHANESTTFKDQSGELEFINKRAASWWSMRELLDPANNPTVAFPPDDSLIGDLAAPRWKQTSSGKIQIESKDDIRKRLGRSTDFGDAIVMAFWEGYAQKITARMLLAVDMEDDD